jgi:hypothetical protein
LQQYPVVAADALQEIGTAVISAVLSLEKHFFAFTVTIESMVRVNKVHPNEGRKSK